MAMTQEFNGDILVDGNVGSDTITASSATLSGAISANSLTLSGTANIAGALRADFLDTTGNTSNQAMSQSAVTLAINNAISSTLLRAYPVGAIYLSIISTSPASLFGGTWEQLTADAYFKIVTSGAGTTAGTSSNHTIPITSMPSHAHVLDCVTNINTSFPGNNASGVLYDGARNANQATLATGGNQSYYPYYYGVYAWRRTA